jgi:choline dehydrogenase-like flavoprotein
VIRPWSERELRTLAVMAETFVPGGDGERRAGLVTGALERVADPAQLAQLRLVLAVMESRAANTLLGVGPVPFSAMSSSTRERYLLGWSQSRIPQRRTVASSLRKLLTFLAYADPGPDGDNPRHAAIGYRPEWPPVTEAPTPIVPLALPLAEGDPATPIILEADVVVVGSGAGGGVVAASLASARRSVVVLEAGPFVDEPSMPTDELDAFARLYLNHGLLSTWDGAITMLAGSGVGGGTLVNWMTTIGAPPAVREEWRRDHGIEGVADGVEWSADVAAIETELGVTETAHPPPKDAAILRGATALGWETAPTRRNTPGCDDCGSCPFGCRLGAKRSGIRVHLAAAYADGTRILARTRVTEVLVEGDRVTGVAALALAPDPVTGEPIADPASPRGVRVRPVVVRAPQVVVAAGALRTPAILEASGLTHPAIGRHLRLHPVPVVAAWFAEPVDMWLGPMQGARSLEFAGGGSGRNGYVIESAPGHAGLLALALPWEGAAEHAAVMGTIRNIAPFIAVTRDGGEGRTTVTRAGTVRVDYRLDATGAATVRHAAGSLVRLARAAGAREILVAATPPLRLLSADDVAAFDRFVAAVGRLDLGSNRASLFSAHQMGTVRMGASPKGHPCDPAGRVRAGPRADRVIGGLYVADASLFPTGIGVNPMLTAMVLARRVAQTVLAEA